MITKALDFLRTRRFSLLLKKHAISENSALIPLNPYYMRYVEGSSCADIYVEDLGDELLFDTDSVQTWHNDTFGVWSSVEKTRHLHNRMTHTDRERVIKIVEAELRIKKNRRLRLLNHDSRSTK